MYFSLIRYDPYNKSFTHEEYNHTLMRENRYNAIQQASSAQRFAVVLGTLGRQGSVNVLEVCYSDTHKLLH